jgi:lysine/ornithine N-monooxygenase
VLPGIQSFSEHGVEFIDGKTEDFDVVILATGYKSNYNQCHFYFDVNQRLIIDLILYVGE